jgi:hypothetical protein
MSAALILTCVPGQKGILLALAATWRPYLLVWKFDLDGEKLLIGICCCIKSPRTSPSPLLTATDLISAQTTYNNIYVICETTNLTHQNQPSEHCGLSSSARRKTATNKQPEKFPTSDTTPPVGRLRWGLPSPSTPLRLGCSGEFSVVLWTENVAGVDACFWWVENGEGRFESDMLCCWKAVDWTIGVEVRHLVSRSMASTELW